MSQESSKLSLDNLSSSGLESSNTSPRKECTSSGFGADTESLASKSQGRNSFRSPITPPPSAASVRAPMIDSYTSVMSSSSDDYFYVNDTTDEDKAMLPHSPSMRPQKAQRSNNKKWRDSVVVEEDSSTPPSVYAGHCNTSEEDSSTFNNIIRFKDSVFALQEEPECSQFSFKPLPSSSSFSSSKYELDKNSSIDESSTESTPGEPYAAMTNIIYSPLVNEYSSPATTASSSCEQLVVKCNPMAMQTGSLFVCPLYEAGVQSSELSDSATTTSTSSTGLSQTMDSDICAAEPVKSKTVPQYENVVISKDTRKSSKSSPPPPPPVRPERHVYQNERLYENHVPKKCSESEKAMTGLVVSSKEVHSDDVYGGEHYENVSDSDDVGEETRLTYGGSNIYEDIDDDQNATVTTQVTNDKNNYETVKVSTSLPESSLPKPNELTCDDGKEDQASDAEEATYESVHYGSSGAEMMGHHYSEIIEKADADYTYVTNNSSKATNSSEESSESHSHTEDMVTYLEVQTPAFLKLHSDSVEEQDHIEEETYAEASEPTSVITSPTVPESGDIRHIDSPVVVENPLYGLEIVRNEENPSLDSVCSIKIDVVEDNDCRPSEKTLGRCNSAPLTETRISDMGLSLTSECSADDDGEDFKDISIKSDGALDEKPENISGSNANSKILLCKRLSEPSLLFNSPGKSKVDERSAAWKIADAKRLATRKQSVRELLSKFETPGDDKPCGEPSSTASNNNASHQHQSGPGLPRPDSRQSLQSSNNNNTVKTNNNNNVRLRNGSGRFQHHRFSMGDILSHSMSGDDELRVKNGGNSMVRSDTYPELRLESSKENQDIDCGSFEGGPVIGKSNYISNLSTCGKRYKLHVRCIITHC